MKFTHFNRTLLLSIAVAFVFGSADVLARKSDDSGTDGMNEDQVNEVAETYNKQQEDEGSKVVCKREAQTGTRFKKTVCRTVATMETDQQNAKRTLNQMKPFTSGSDQAGG